MDCLTFRLAAIEEAGLVQAIRARAYIPAYTAVIGVAPKPAFEDYRPRIERGEVWMAALGTEPVGILVMEDAPNHMLIYSVAVEPSHQGKGLAKAIVGQAERIARGKGKPELRLYTNQKMRARSTAVLKLRVLRAQTSPSSKPVRRILGGHEQENRLAGLRSGAPCRHSMRAHRAPRSERRGTRFRAIPEAFDRNRAGRRSTVNCCRGAAWALPTIHARKARTRENNLATRISTHFCPMSGVKPHRRITLGMPCP
ncbi:GNAT family N-acetyltransferase (plasmid) [Sinorhizobium meliloti]|nr:GNAT family N-acetyltransferase [Sinorhizobium meliloti]